MHRITQAKTDLILERFPFIFRDEKLENCENFQLWTNTIAKRENHTPTSFDGAQQEEKESFDIHDIYFPNGTGVGVRADVLVKWKQEEVGKPARSM